MNGDVDNGIEIERLSISEGKTIEERNKRKLNENHDVEPKRLQTEMGRKKENGGKSTGIEMITDDNMAGAGSATQQTRTQKQTKYTTKDLTQPQTQQTKTTHIQAQDIRESRDTSSKRERNKTANDTLNLGQWEKNNVHTVFFIERQNKEDKPIHPMLLAKILHNVGIKHYKELKSAGFGRFRITFNKPKDAEVLLNSALLRDNFKINIYIPNVLKQTIGVVRNVPPTISEEEILDNINAGNKRVTKIERINKMKKVEGNNVLVPTYSIKIYVEGQVLPEEIAIYGMLAKVDFYVFPVKLCIRCWRFGHRIKTCRSSKPRCVVCGLDHEGEVCWDAPTCVNCNGNHKANDRNCPERVRQDMILQVMAREKLTFAEANMKFPRNRSVQDRLKPAINSIQEFPTLPSRTSNQETVHKQPQKLISNANPNTNIEEIVNRVKTELIKQLNLDTIMDKIKTIQETISNNNQLIKSGKQSKDAQTLLTEIMNEMKSIANPEITVARGTTQENNSNPQAHHGPVQKSGTRTT